MAAMFNASVARLRCHRVLEGPRAVATPGSRVRCAFSAGNPVTASWNPRDVLPTAQVDFPQEAGVGLDVWRAQALRSRRGAQPDRSREPCSRIAAECPLFPKRLQARHTFSS